MAQRSPPQKACQCLLTGVHRTEVVNGRVKEHGRLLRGSPATTVRSLPGRGPANTQRKSLARRAWVLAVSSATALGIGAAPLRRGERMIVAPPTARRMPQYQCYPLPVMVRVLTLLIVGSLLASCAVFQPVGDLLLGNTAAPIAPAPPPTSSPASSATRRNENCPDSGACLATLNGRGLY
jgi:hypothetical protein